jgi:hypothetical protein
MAGSYTGETPEIMSRQGFPNSSQPPASGGSTGLKSPSSGSLPRLPRISTEPIEDSVPPEPSRPKSNAPVAFYGNVTVAWDSAAPIRWARREPLGPQFDRHYAIRVTGLPVQSFMSEGGRIPMIFRLLTGALLDARGKKRESADYVTRVPETRTMVFAFRASEFPLRRGDRFVSFSLNLDDLVVKARFDLRLMTWRDLLAV